LPRYSATARVVQASDVTAANVVGDAPPPSPRSPSAIAPRPCV